MRGFWADVQALDNQIEAGTQLAMLNEARRLVERAARWLVRSGARGGSTSRRWSIVSPPAAQMLPAALPDVLRGQDHEAFTDRLVELEAAGVPDALARRVASMQALLYVFDIVVEAAATERPQAMVMDAYFDIGARLRLDWLRDRILELPRDDRWQALARTALRDDLYRLHRSLIRDVFATAGRDGDDPRWKRGWTRTARPWSGRSPCWPMSGPRASTTRRRFRSPCASSRTSSPKAISSSSDSAADQRRPT